jgi:hypothetical protein
MKTFLVAALAVLVLASQAFGDPIIDKLQAGAVTVRAGGAQGSGMLVVRKAGDKTLTFVWTAAHVVDGLRKTRIAVDPKTGTPRTTIEFLDAGIVQEYREEGRRVGEVVVDARVLKYSDAETGEDLAILQIRKRDFAPDSVSTQFYLDAPLPALGTELYHIGSLLGQFGSNSLTTGVISQHGRVLNLSGSNGVIFDQTTATAFPGSSGGGVFLKTDGRYVGMIVRGAGEGFNFIVPVRRMRDWAKRTSLEWALDPAIPTPSEADLAKIVAEDSGPGNGKSEDSKQFSTLEIRP